ncbi:MAG: hypothetical protein GY756_14095 [bacterium]|nr:hypothetical protein [bacterium]
MTEKELSQITEIDKINMSKFLLTSDKPFDIKLRKNGIEEEIKKGAVFILAYEVDKIIAYVEYMERDNKSLTIKSIQINPSKMNGFTLKKLIAEIYPKFKNTFEDYRIISATHTINRPSIVLHKKLGFYETDRDKNRIIYECKGIDFINNLGKYIK